MNSTNTYRQGDIKPTVGGLVSDKSTPSTHRPISLLPLPHHSLVLALYTFLLLPLLFFGSAAPSYADAYITDGSSTKEIQASGNCRQSKEGIYANGYMKYVTGLIINCSDATVGPASASYWYSIKGIENQALTSNQEGTSYLSGTPMEVSGEIISMDALKQDRDTSKIIGMLYNDEQDLIGSWLVVKGFDMPASDLAKVRAMLTKQLQANNKELLTQISDPVWLFRVMPDLSLTLEP